MEAGERRSPASYGTLTTAVQYTAGRRFVARSGVQDEVRRQEKRLCWTYMDNH